MTLPTTSSTSESTVPSQPARVHQG
ncbi:MAG: hypothetical protein QOF82_1719, partial [Frankiales bacterium]|nr:hypothetical protein [Frankiales bacterium]